MKDTIIDLLKSLWNKIKKISTAIFNFLSHLVAFFKSKFAQKLKNHPNAEAISMKIGNKLSTGDYSTLDWNLRDNTEESIVNLFYDKSTGKIINEDEDDIQLVSYKQVDIDTQKAFGDKDMLVLN